MNKRHALLCLSLALPVLAASVSPARAAAQKEETKKDTLIVTEELLRKGKALFTGEMKFAKGGAPCAACHAIRYPGVQGGSWGPDLTEMYADLGEDGMLENLKDPAFAGMKKMYRDKPLAVDEIKALAVFAKGVTLGKKEKAPHNYPWAGIAFFGVIMGIFSLYKWRIR